jgi:glyoxylase-like metal-dependent hydrolase (beta-lactamase superfamily II)
MFRELEQLAPRVYLFPRDETPNTIQPNIGLIGLSDQTILIDGGNSSRHARRIQTALDLAGLPPIQTIILTHHHWDHTFGLSSFSPHQIISHTLCAKYLREYAKKEWNPMMLREDTANNPKREISNNAIIDAISDWHSFRIVLPSMCFNHNLTLYFDELEIELEHVGGRHADDSIVVRLPEQSVMFLGDSHYPPPYDLREEDDIDLDIVMLDSFLAQSYAIYVDGHGPPRNQEAFAKMIAWERARQELD